MQQQYNQYPQGQQQYQQPQAPQYQQLQYQPQPEPQPPRQPKAKKTVFGIITTVIFASAVLASSSVILPLPISALSFSFSSFCSLSCAPRTKHITHGTMIRIITTATMTCLKNLTLPKYKIGPPVLSHIYLIIP